MIRAQTENAPALMRQLARRARTLAAAHARARARARRGDETRWREPALLWPLFGEEA